jgi:hypothetical protein
VRIEHFTVYQLFYQHIQQRVPCLAFQLLHQIPFTLSRLSTQCGLRQNVSLVIAFIQPMHCYTHVTKLIDDLPGNRISPTIRRQ